MAQNDDFVRYTVRIPAGLYNRVKQAAGAKSVNAEIVAALEEKYPSPSFDELLAEFERHMQSLTYDDARSQFIDRFFDTLDEPMIDQMMRVFQQRRAGDKTA